MKTYHLTGNAPYFTNCYMVCSDENTAVLIDCSADINNIKKILENDRVELKAILLTHGHRDHIETLKEVRQEFDCPVYLSRHDARLFEIEGTAGYPCDFESGDRAYKLSIDDITFYCVSTPGHTPGSVCLVCEDMLFSGDTLFAGTVGRTDLRGGDPKALEDSLKKIAAMITRNLKVLPGHNHFSTFDIERKTNPYLREL